MDVCEVDHPATVERRCTPYQLGVYTNLSVTGEPTEFLGGSVPHACLEHDQRVQPQ